MRDLMRIIAFPFMAIGYICIILYNVGFMAIIAILIGGMFAAVVFVIVAILLPFPLGWFQ